MNIDKRANQQLNDFWQNRIKEYGNNFKVVGWTKESQQKRFEAILQLGELENSSLLDIGCGRGDLYKFLHTVKSKISYTGFDLNPTMIEYCQQLYPEIKDSFKVFDIMKGTPEKRYDYATCIGVLNQFTAPDSPEFAAKFIEKLFSLVNRAVAIAVTSIHAPRKTPDTFYFDPKDMLEKISRFCTNFKIDHSYLKNDFTIFLYKN